MTAATDVKMVTIHVDGQPHQVPAGTNLIDAVTSIGREIPHYCYHPKLSVSGNCRMCLVEMGMPMRDRATGQAVLDEQGNPKIGWMPKPAIACSTNCSEGLHVKTESELVKSCREGVMEFLLVNHPLDCPICDQAGECSLQEFATDYGRGYSRFVEQKNVKPKRTRLGPRVTLDDERCILCSRCVRFCKEIVGEEILGFTERGSFSTLTCYPGKELNTNYSLNTVDICPVGALTSTDFRFKMRVWFLKPVNSICTESSVGVNTQVWAREGKIYRITPRSNDAVNDTWMPDSGRMLYKQVESEDRLTAFKVDGNKVKADDALVRASELIRHGKVAYVGSSHLSVEELYMLRELIGCEPGPVEWASHTGESDGLLISADRTPNLRGALALGLVKDVPSSQLDGLATRLAAGEFDTLVVVREDITQLGLTEAQLKKINIIYLGTHQNGTSALAKVLLPAATVFERSGSFINQQFRLQTFRQVVPAPAGILPDLILLARLVSLLRGENAVVPTLDQVWDAMAVATPLFNGLTYSTIPESGHPLDGSAYAGLAFPETKTLHYEPAGATV
jgi:NADH-quinone oxidoreductase subunit G